MNMTGFVEVISQVKLMQEYCALRVPTRRSSPTSARSIHPPSHAIHAPSHAIYRVKNVRLQGSTAVSNILSFP